MLPSNFRTKTTLGRLNQPSLEHGVSMHVTHLQTHIRMPTEVTFISTPTKNSITLKVFSPLIDANGKLLTYDLDKASVLNNFFGSVGITDNGHQPTCTQPDIDDALCSVIFTPTAVLKAIKKTKNNNTSGPDGFPSTLVKNMYNALALPLSIIFESFMSVGKTPSAWGTQLLLSERFLVPSVNSVLETIYWFPIDYNLQVDPMRIGSTRIHSSILSDRFQDWSGTAVASLNDETIPLGMSLMATTEASGSRPRNSFTAEPKTGRRLLIVHRRYFLCQWLQGAQH